MWFIDGIAQWLAGAANRFYQAYIVVHSWVWPFYQLATPLLYLNTAFSKAAYYTSFLSEWADSAAMQLRGILNPLQIISYLQTWLTMAEQAYTWIWNSVTNVVGIVNNWWNSITPTVQAWINIAQQWLQQQINSLSTQFVSLQQSVAELLSELPSLDEILAWFSDWWARILSPLTSWWNERLKDLSPFWEGWQDVKQDAITFLNDPLEWLWVRFADWFLGKE